MFYAIVTGELSYSRNVMTCRLGKLPLPTAQLIVLQGEKYLDWLPWDKVSDRCKLYLEVKGNPTVPCGRPFVELIDGDKDVISRIVKIRHAIAHASDSAKAKFVKDIIGNTAVLPHERTPAGFLCGLHSPGKSRLDNYMDSLLTTAVKIFGTPRKRRK